MKRLTVYLTGEPVGSLVQDDSGLLEFSYAPGWLARPGAIPLSRSLPLRAESFIGKQARPFFAGILPEEEPRRIIAAILGVSERNDFALLERIGGECAGAVTLLPEGTRQTAEKEADLRILSEDDLQRIIGELPKRPLMAGEEGVRLSLAGAQDKLPVVLQGNRVALPLGDTPSTHIIKPEPIRFPGLSSNECFCMTLAKALGLKVSNVERRIIGDKSCLIVQRYDRSVGADGTVSRIHQEDFCQALGFPPERKYQQEGGPLLRDCITLLREWSTTPVLDIPDFLDGQIFNVLIGNADAHGKNYSLLYQGDGQRRLAPFYDLVSTLAWPELSKIPAMKIGKSETLDVFTPSPWKTLAQEANLGWPMVKDRITDLGRRTVETLRCGHMQSMIQADSMSACVAAQTADRASAILQGFSA